MYLSRQDERHTGSEQQIMFTPPPPQKKTKLLSECKSLEYCFNIQYEASLPRSSSSELGLHLPKQSLPISTKFRGSISAHCEVVLDITLFDQVCQ